MTSDFFEGLHKSAGHRNFHPVLQQCPTLVTDEMNTNLIAKVTLTEIHQAVFAMGPLKAPGPDGLNGLFYQKNWESIKMGLFEEIKAFFETRSMNSELNRTHITLIPKVKNLEGLDQFRLISLCNFAYKIISKILANRVKR